VDLSALPTALVRAIAVGALLVLFGTLLLRRAMGANLSKGGNTTRVLRRLEHDSLIVAAVAVLLWLLLVAHALIGGGLAAALAGLPLVRETRFGEIGTLRLLALLVAVFAWVLRRGWSREVALAAAGMAVALQAGHLHALAMHRGPSVLLGSEVLHVLGAGAWIGALPALLAILLAGTPAEARCAVRRFWSLGLAGVLLLAGSAAYQALVLLGGVRGALGTPYGQICLAKIALFLLLLGFGVRHRFVLAPRLEGPAAAGVQAAFARSVALELVVGGLVVVLAALLSTAPPGMHMEMP
jgi:putative copper resistance protein D